MNDFFDYLLWRGDLDFSTSPFNDVDALIFTQLVYLDFSGLLPSPFGETVTLRELSARFRGAEDFEMRSDVGLIINERCVDLLFACAATERFGAVRVGGYVNKCNARIEEQFSAAFFCADDFCFVSFCGTDDTLVGWKEDFNLACLEKIPAQEDALSYLKKAVRLGPPVLVGGHSNGGNLAIYAAAHLSDDEKRHVVAVYNFDGPGFSQKALESAEFKAIEKKTKSFFPQFSVIGMMFRHFKTFSVVRSGQKFVRQHDPFSWFVGPRSLVTQEKLDRGSRRFHLTFNTWFEKLSPEKRSEFVDTFFGVLKLPTAESLSELTEHLAKNSFHIVKAISSLDSDTIKSTLHTVLSILKEAGAELSEVFSETRHVPS